MNSSHRLFILLLLSGFSSIVAPAPEILPFFQKRQVVGTGLSALSTPILNDPEPFPTSNIQPLSTEERPDPSPTANRTPSNSNPPPREPTPEPTRTPVRTPPPDDDRDQDRNEEKERQRELEREAREREKETKENEKKGNEEKEKREREMQEQLARERDRARELEREQNLERERELEQEQEREQVLEPEEAQPSAPPPAPAATSSTPIATPTPLLLAPSQPSSQTIEFATTFLTVLGSQTVLQTQTSTQVIPFTDLPIDTHIIISPDTTVSPSLSGDESKSDTSGISEGSRKVIAGVLGSVGGAVLLGGILVVAWRVWGKRKRNNVAPDHVDDGDVLSATGDSVVREKTGASPFKDTLDQYHGPGRAFNTAQNF